MPGPARNTNCDDPAPSETKTEHVDQCTEAKAAPRTCRVCLQNEEEDDNDPSASSSGGLISPCSCTGTNQWVHAKCLRTWLVAVYQRGGDATRCELCRQPYVIKGLAPKGAHKHWLWKRWQPALVLTLLVCCFSLCSGITDGLTLSPLRILALCALAAACQWLCVGVEAGFIAGPLLLLVIAMLFGWGIMYPPWMATGDAVPELRAGIALSFRRENGRVGGGPFSESIVLITEYDYARGAVGYIINKVVRKTADRSGEGLFDRSGKGRLWWPQDDNDSGSHEELDSINLKNLPLRLGYGGPVPTMRNGGWEVIHTAGDETMVRGSTEVLNLEGVYVGGRRDDLLKELQHGEAPRHPTLQLSHPRAIAVRGYAGWAPSQLDGEVRRGAWAIHKVNASLIFDLPVNEMYGVISALDAEGGWGSPQKKR